MSGVQIVSTTKVTLPPDSNPPPPDHVSLSVFDTFWLPLPPIQRLLLYPDAAAADLPSLRSSLSATLRRFFPLAGRLAYVPSTRDVVIDCSSSTLADGVAFAEAESDADIRRLAEDVDHDVKTFLQLVPDIGAKELPLPVFAVQVTRFVGGGVAVGFAAHHAVADGRGMRQFVEAWAAECRGEAGAALQLPVVLDRALIQNPKADEIARTILHSAAPSLPQLPISHIVPLEGRFQLARRTFVLDQSAIQSLKQRVVRHSDASQPPPTTFLAISAHAWASFIGAKGVPPDEDTVLSFLADCRLRLDPPVDESYFGNCVKTVNARVLAGELAGAGGLARACSAIVREMDDRLAEPLADADEWLSQVAEWPFSRHVSVAASPWFKVYETNFGFGRPGRVELVSNTDGEMVMAAARDGGVQVSAAVVSACMDGFSKLFLAGFNSEGYKLLPPFHKHRPF